jgi:hypothetical protein
MTFVVRPDGLAYTPIEGLSFCSRGGHPVAHASREMDIREYIGGVAKPRHKNVALGWKSSAGADGKLDGASMRNGARPQ